MQSSSTYRLCFKLSIYCMLVLLPFSPLRAQHASIEQLKIKLKTIPYDTNKVILWKELADKFIYTHPDSAISWALKADSLSKQLSYLRGHALALNSLGNANWSKGNLKESLSYFIQSRQIANEAKDEQLVAQNIGSMGVIYRAAENHEAALSYYRQALPLFFELNKPEKIASLYNNIGKCFLEMGNYDSASYYIHKAYPLAEEYIPQILPILAFNHADIFFRKAQYAQAEEYLKDCLSSSYNFEDQRMIIRGEQMMAEIKLLQDSLADAKPLAINAVHKAEATSVKELIYICYQTLSHIYAKEQQFDSAYYYLNLYNVYKDSIQSQNLQEKISFNDFENQQKEILSLTKENALESDMRKRQKSYIYGLIALLVVILLLVAILLHSRQQKTNDNKLLKIKNEEIHFQNEEIAIQAEELQSLNQLKNKLFSIISHDLRSPLNSLSGSLELVQSGIIDNNEFKSFLPELIKNVSYTNTLLDNLLHWAKNQLEGTEINPEKVNLKRVAHLKAELLKHQAEHKSIRLQNHIDQDIYVYADEIMIQIVLQNLISNAIKFCRSGDKIDIYFEIEDQHVIIYVKDSGTGIQQENLDQLFKKTSFSTRGTANEKGTGLGLMLCKDFVEKNGGEIWAESTPGNGSTFYFTLKPWKASIYKDIMTNLS